MSKKKKLEDYEWDTSDFLPPFDYRTIYMSEKEYEKAIRQEKFEKAMAKINREYGKVLANLAKK